MALNRPISPFLSVYRLQVGSFFSIFSRITGLILLFCLIVSILLLALFPTWLTYYPFFFFFYLAMKGTYTMILISFVFVFFSVTLFYHFATGLRYLLWSYDGGLSFRFMNFYDLTAVKNSLQVLGVSSLFLGPFLLVLL